MKGESVMLWLQVVLEDTVSEFIYSPLFITIVAIVLTFFDILPIPYQFFVAAALILGTLFLVRSIWVWVFIKNSNPVIAYVGKNTGKFRKWTEYWIHFEEGGRRFETKHTFLRKEIAEGEPVLVLVHHRQKRRVLIVHRMRDKESLVS